MSATADAHFYRDDDLTDENDFQQQPPGGPDPGMDTATANIVWCLMCCGLCPCWEDPSKDKSYAPVATGGGKVLQEDDDGLDDSDDDGWLQGDEDDDIFRQQEEQKEKKSKRDADLILEALRTGQTANGLTHDTLSIDLDAISEKYVVEILHELWRNPAIKITTLELNNNDYKDDATMAEIASLIRGNRRLTRLSICGNEVRDRGAFHIASGLGFNSTLRELQLQRDNIGPDGIKELSQALKDATSQLAFLSLSHNNAGDEGVEYLCDALKENKTITTLELSACGITDRGAKMLADLLATPGQALEKLHLRKNEIGDQGVIALTEALTNNTVLTRLYLQNQEGPRLTQASIEAVHSCMVNSTQRILLMDRPVASTSSSLDDDDSAGLP